MAIFSKSAKATAARISAIYFSVNRHINVMQSLATTTAPAAVNVDRPSAPRIGSAIQGHAPSTAEGKARFVLLGAGLLCFAVLWPSLLNV